MSQDTPSTALLAARGLAKHYDLGSGFHLGRKPVRLRAVDSIDFAIQPNETFSLVGESGSGKTTTAKLILGLEPPSAGAVLFRGEELARLGREKWREYRVSVQAVFQDPWSSLNPRMRIGAIVAEPLVVNRRLGRRDLQERVDALLAAVGLDPGQKEKYPHELSGGMRQRLSVARALALNPPLIVLDEPVSALDVSIRAQIMNLLQDLQQSHSIAYFLIAHDLATVRYLSHKVAVMYLGQFVEVADASALFQHPLHPYTQALIASSMPVQPEEPRDEIVLEGDAPSPIAPPSGCRFHPRCPFAFDRCRAEVPKLAEQAPGHVAACHLY